MIEKPTKTGFYFRLEKQDWKADHKGFIAAVKKLKSVTYNPAELDDDGFWYCGNVDRTAWLALKTIYIDQLLRDKANDAKAGFKPLPRAGYGRRTLKY